MLRVINFWFAIQASRRAELKITDQTLNEFRRILTLVFLCAFLTQGHVLFAQGKDAGALRQAAADHMKYEEYHQAVPVLEQLIKMEPENASFNFWFGKSLYNTYQKKRSLKYLRKANELDPEIDREINHYLAHSLHYNHFFKEAIQQYQLDLKHHRINSEPFEYVMNRIAQCDYGERMMKNLNPDWDRVIITNLGDSINTEFAEHSPVISANDSILLYTARRPECLGADPEAHFYDEDVYLAYKKDGKWMRGKNIWQPVNSKGHDATIALTADGMTLFIYRHKKDGGFYVTKFDTLGKVWREPKPMEKPFNSRFYEACVFLSPDGEKLYFSSNRPGGYGGKDIYVSYLQDDGEFGEPQNLGPKVNGPFDEDSPFLHPDGKRLYFSSNGPNSIGGFDLFLTEMSEDGKDWLTPINMGYPVNDADDDIYFVLNSEGNTGYYASGKEGGLGEKDIYSIEFPYYPYPRRHNIIVLEGAVIDKFTSDTLEARVRLINKTTGAYQEMMVNRIDPRMFHFELAAESDYVLEVVSEGYGEHSETLISPRLMGKDIYIERTILLGNPVVAEEDPVEIMNIYYDFDLWDLREESVEELDRVVAYMKADPNIELEIRGHTDWYNTVKYNQDLSENRAGEPYKYLLLEGIERKRIRLKGFSENNPLDINENDEGRQYNRRAEFVFYRGSKIVYKSVKLRSGIDGVRVDHAPPKGKPGFDEPESVVFIEDSGSEPYSRHSASNRDDHEAVRIYEYHSPLVEIASRR